MIWMIVTISSVIFVVGTFILFINITKDEFHDIIWSPYQGKAKEGIAPISTGNGHHDLFADAGKDDIEDLKRMLDAELKQAKEAEENNLPKEAVMRRKIASNIESQLKKLKA